MGRTGQIRQFRRTRHRAALQRRGCTPPPHWFDAHCPTLVAGDGGLPLDGSDAVESLVWKATAYPWVREGHLRVRGDRVDVRFLVPRPLERAMAWVVEIWHTEIETRHPGITWNLSVTAHGPEPWERFQLLFRHPTPS